VKLLKLKYDFYPGTEIPRDYQSRVRIENPGRGENREVDIYMNNPLRYEGQTFYQFQMGPDKFTAGNRDFSALQVVKNPSWLTPYVGCLMVGGGMVYQFLFHLVGFISKRRTA
jgi:ResB-like family